MRHDPDAQAKPDVKVTAYKSSLADPRDDFWREVVRHRDRLKTFETPRQGLRLTTKQTAMTH